MDRGGSPGRPSPRGLRALLILLAASATAVLLGADDGEARRAPAAPEADISSPVDIADGNCSFGPTFDRAFENMIFQRQGRPPTTRPIVIGGQRLSPRLTSSREDGVRDPSVRRYESSVRLSRPVRWNGLRLTALSAGIGWEWSATSLEFADRPERVRDALRAVGLEMPLPPASRDIHLEACSAAISIEVRGGGSALTCSSGC